VSGGRDEEREAKTFGADAGVDAPVNAPSRAGTPVVDAPVNAPSRTGTTFVDDATHDGIDEREAERHIEFLRMLKLTGDFYGQPFEPLMWQADVIRHVYGTLTDAGVRKYKYAYLEIPKKNGKTELIASLALDHLMNDPPGGEIYCCAAEREQAGLVYNAEKSKIEQDAYLDEYLRVVDSAKVIYNDDTGTFIKVLSAEAYSKHGLNPSVIIFDELHALQKRDLWDTMTFGSGSARKRQLIWVITTAGDDPDKTSIGWEQHEYARKVRDGEIDDPSWFVRIYGAPEDADIYDEAVWYAANPSLGATISIDEVREEARGVKKDPGKEKLFRWLRLNQWVALKRLSWLPLTLWDATEGDWTEDDMAGRDCYLGVDLSTTTDLSAAACVFPPRKSGEVTRFLLDIWIPEDKMRERSERDHVPFERWVRGGYVRATPGGVVDYGYIASRIRSLSERYRVRYICGDPWHLEILRQLCGTDIQRKFVQISQDMKGLSPALLELERQFLLREISHAANPCGRWCFGNCVVAIDGNENKKLMKNRSSNRIDPIVALNDAMAGVVQLEPKRSVYEERGLLRL
jgi:phage terminase large subunit-like protein